MNKKQVVKDVSESTEVIFSGLELKKQALELINLYPEDNNKYNNNPKNHLINNHTLTKNKDSRTGIGFQSIQVAKKRFFK